MKGHSNAKKVISVFIAMIMGITALVPGFSALADTVIDYYDIELFYNDNKIVPDYDDEGRNFIQYMVEGETLQLNYQLIDCALPDSGYVKWYSETPTLVDVNQNGLVKAFDSSKGAVIHSWIDNEVKTIPLVGDIMGQIVEKIFFNEYVDLDTLDTDGIVAILEAAFGSDSYLSKLVPSYQGQLIDSLRYYLDNVNSNIHVVMYDATGKELADDYVQVCVLKSKEWYAEFLPNGTHITNKGQIETTVAKGSTAQLHAVTTPTRLRMGVIYSVKSSSIFTQGKVIATVNDGGLVSFKNTGTVTIMVSPDTDGFIQNLLKLVNYFYSLGDTSSIDTNQLAGILIDYIGIDMNRAALAAILDVCFAVVDIVQSGGNPVQLTATAVKIISNLILQFVFNDEITFTVIDRVPLTDFAIDGADTVQEGSQIGLEIVNPKPVAADLSDITWKSSDESIAHVDPITGVITGRDAGGSLGLLSSQTCVITATSAANQVVRQKTIKVVGRTGRYISDVAISGEDKVKINDEQDLTYKVYPARVAIVDNLTLTWGLVTEGTDPKSYEYVWAGDPYDETVVDELTGLEEVIHRDGAADNGFATVDKNGHYVAKAGGEVTVALKAVTGYELIDGSFYEISSVIGHYKIFNGQPVTGLELVIDEHLGGIGAKMRTDVFILDGVKHYIATIDLGAGGTYLNSGVKLKIKTIPEDATNKNVTWHSDNNNFSVSVKDDIAEIKIKAGVTTLQSTNVYCVSEDGNIPSNTVTISVNKNPVGTNTINSGAESVLNGQSKRVDHTVTKSSNINLADSCPDANWYSSDESILSVKNNRDSSGSATITGVDVGTATLYCVSADGGKTDTVTVTVYPDKNYLQEIVNICENTVIKRTDENLAQYKDFSKKLDYAYYILYNVPMANQDTCNTYAEELLYSFYKLGGYIGLNGVEITKPDGSDIGMYHTVKVNTLNYRDTTYTLRSQLMPKDSMYRSIKWTSTLGAITVDSMGRCRPASNKECWDLITVEAEDYMGNVFTDIVVLTFAKTPVTGISFDETSITGAKVGTKKVITPTVTPKPGAFGTGGASVDTVVWTSSDENVVTVKNVDNKNSGELEFLYGGDAVITATTVDGGYTAYYYVNVVTNYDKLNDQATTYRQFNLEPLNYYPETYDAYIEKLEEAEALVKAENSTQNEVDEMLAELIAAYQGLRKYEFIKEIEIYLNGEPSSEFYQYDLSFFKEGISYQNAKLNLNVRLYPNGANYKSVKWKSNHDAIVITEDGVASPRRNESCYGQIECEVEDHHGNKFYDTVWVSFAYVPVTGILVLSEDSNNDEFSGEIGDKTRLSASIQPKGITSLDSASIQDFYWESMDESIATVDERGNVEIVGAGATIVRAVSYDGGVTGDFKVSGSGNRNALRDAVEKYKDIVYTDYTYQYGMAFYNAYEHAKEVLKSTTVTQAEIDKAYNDLIEAYNYLESNKYVAIEEVAIHWVGKNNNTLKNNGYISADTDAVSINFGRDGYNSNNTYNNIELSPEYKPNYADVKSIEWRVESSENLAFERNGNNIKMRPSARSLSGYAVLTAVLTDSYGKTTQRTVTIVMADETVTGITIPQVEERFATDDPFELGHELSFTGNAPNVSKIAWTSSNEEIATVDENGVVTPIDRGTAFITAKTYDGGFTSTCAVVIKVNFDPLEHKIEEYQAILNDIEDAFIYTEDSLKAFTESINVASAMFKDKIGNQAQINEQIRLMDEAYNGLVEYVISEGISIGVDVDSQNDVSQPNPGFIRYTNMNLYNKTIRLSADVQPANGFYDEIKWTSSNSDIEVDDDGVCTYKNALNIPKWSLITCTIKNARGQVFQSTIYICFVRYAVEEISFDEDIAFGSQGDTVQLKPNIKSSAIIQGAVLTDCFYESSDESIATVNEKGVVTFVSQGVATITATAYDGGLTATIEARTTWDTEALKGALSEANEIDHMDYCYEYGTAFLRAKESAQDVYDDPYSTQEEINAACDFLMEAIADLKEDGREFIYPGDISILNGEDLISNGSAVILNEDGKAVLSAGYAEDAMIKDSQWSTDSDVNVNVETDDNGNFVLSKIDDEKLASTSVTFTLTDDYDRTYTKTVSIKLVKEKVHISDFAFTYLDEEVTSVTNPCAGVYTGKSIQLGVNTYPLDADAYTSIEWKSSNSTNLPINQDGVVSTAGVLMASSYYTLVTCIITLDDGSTIEKTIGVTFTRN